MDERIEENLKTEEAAAVSEEAASPLDEEAALRKRLKEAADAANQRAADDSPGIVSGALGERLYSIDEMRQMTPKQVKGRYHSLLASLKRGFSKW